MTELVWDQVGDRKYEAGVDRCVLYMQDGRAVAWNGITSIDEQPDQTSESFYLDGVKFLERVRPGDYAGSIKAYTYPVEFDEVLGMEAGEHGLLFHNQQPQSFSLCYRTGIGNDSDGMDHGYKIHILYNLVAIPDAFSYQTLGQIANPVEFGWTMRGVPEIIAGHRPTVHVSFNSTSMEHIHREELEEVLYGTDTTDPSLPTLSELLVLLESFGSLIITDNGDGTWTANDPNDSFITMTSETEFRIDDADVEVIDEDTYTISTTTVE